MHFAFILSAFLMFHSNRFLFNSIVELTVSTEEKHFGLISMFCFQQNFVAIRNGWKSLKFSKPPEEEILTLLNCDRFRFLSLFTSTTNVIHNKCENSRTQQDERDKFHFSVISYVCDSCSPASSCRWLLGRNSSRTRWGMEILNLSKTSQNI